MAPLCEHERRGGGGAYIEELSKSSGAEYPGVASSIGVAAIASVEDAWVARSSVVSVDLRRCDGDQPEERGVTLYSLQNRVL
jgi:hypothetical protein